jgi:hypothetical protein
MLSEQEHIDDFFRRRQKELKIDEAGKTAHWQQMSALLNEQIPVPPKKRFWKKITHRTITYMGVIAVVITTTYYTVTTAGKKNAAKKNTAALTIKKNDFTRQQTSVLQQPVVPLNRPVKTTRVSASAKTIIIKPVKKYRSNTAIIKLKQKSDTVFLPIAPANIAENTFAQRSAIENFYSRLKQPYQQFKINAAKDTLLFAADGTVLKIPANAFMDSNKKPASYPITIQLTECYQYASMLANNLTTLCNNQQLVTGGMINIKAFDAANNPLQLFYNRPVQISMPAERFDAGMQLFVADTRQAVPSVIPEFVGDTAAIADENVINWRAAGQPQGYTNTSRFIHPGKIKLFDVRQAMTDATQKKEAVYLVKINKNIDDDKIKQLISSKYFTDITKVKLQRVQSFGKEVKGKNTNVMITKEGFVAGDSVMISFEKAVKEGLLSTGDSIAFVKQVKADSLLFAEKRRQDSIVFIKQKEFERTYNFDITRLGWINCDKFYKADVPKIEFTITVDIDLEKAMGNYNLVFTNIKSVIKGRYKNGQIHFGALPLNEPIQLVCVAVQNNKAIACIKSFKIAPDVFTSLQFTEMTPEEFTQKLVKL